MKVVCRQSIKFSLVSLNLLSLAFPPTLPVVAQSLQPIWMSQSTSADYVRRGNQRFEQKDFQGAIADYNQALRLNPTSDLAFRNRALARLNLNDYREAIADYDQAIRLNPNVANAYVNRGFARFKLQDYQGAIDDYNQAIRLDPSSHLAFLNRGDAHRILGDFQAAIADANQVIRLDSKNASAYDLRANAHLLAGNLQAALADANELVRLAPTRAAGFNIRGGVNYFLANYPSALADANKGIQIDPKSPDAYMVRGAAQLGLRNYQAAQADLAQAVQLDPTNGFTYYFRGLLALRQGNNQAAIADYERALQLIPGFRVAKTFEDYSLIARRQNNTSATAVAPPPPPLASPASSLVPQTAPVSAVSQPNSGVRVNEVARAITVFIQSNSRPGEVFGSGVIVNRNGNTYTVISAKHVVALTDSYTLTTPDGKKHTIRQVEKLPNSDIAILRFESNSPYSVVATGGQPVELDTLYIAGFPKPTASVPTPRYYIVDAKVNTVLEPNQASEGYALRYGLRGQFREGMSGGPVLNGRGELIAIHGRADELGGLGIPVTLLSTQAKAAGIVLGLR